MNYQNLYPEQGRPFAHGADTRNIRRLFLQQFSVVLAVLARFPMHNVLLVQPVTRDGALSQDLLILAVLCVMPACIVQVVPQPAFHAQLVNFRQSDGLLPAMFALVLPINLTLDRAFARNVAQDLELLDKQLAHLELRLLTG